MPCRMISYQSKDDWKGIRELLAGRDNPENSVEPVVREILHHVHTEGDKALVHYTQKFDCPSFTADMVQVSEETLARAASEIPAEDFEIIKEAAANIRSFHENQKEKSWFTTSEDGTILGQVVRPVDRAGLYVPGGKGGDTPLISSMLMNVIPAQVAGVEDICVVSPPRADGVPNQYILAAAHHLGIKNVFACGSAWAIAALAYGTDTIPAVDVIAGPGNIFVTTAKRMFIGTVGIDMVAGPSEILILADNSGNPVQIAADMLSQAEHDPLASAILVTDSEQLAQRVCDELATQTGLLPRNDIASAALRDWSAIIVTPDMDTAVELSNNVAPEHLEVLVEDPWTLLPAIRNAGAIFMGANSPEPVGTILQARTTYYRQTVLRASLLPCLLRPSQRNPALLQRLPPSRRKMRLRLRALHGLKD